MSFTLFCRLNEIPVYCPFMYFRGSETTSLKENYKESIAYFLIVSDDVGWLRDENDDLKKQQ